MGIASNVIILMIIMSYVFYAGTPNHESSVFFSLVGVSSDVTTYYPNGTVMTTPSKVSRIHSNFLLLLGLTATASLATAILYRSEPTYVLFAGFVTFIVSFFTLPLDVFASAVIPQEIKFLIGGIYGIMLILAAADFFRGTGGLA